MKPEDAVAVETRPVVWTVKNNSSTRQFAVISFCLIVLAAGLVMSTVLGAVTVAPNEVLAALLGDAERVPRQIVWNLRVPRALVGGLVGMNLAVAGALLQGIMRNPLAAPTIVGVTAGAGLAAAAVIILLPGVAALLPPIAFLGAMAASVFVYVLSWQPGIGTSPVRMVLAGVAVTTMLGAFTTGLMTVFSDRVQSVVLWMAGNLVGRSWNHLELIWFYSVIGVVDALLLVRQLNVMQLGDEAAQGLGLRVERGRFMAMGLAALLAASAVSVAGLVGFVGLIVPHVMRLLGGHNHVYLVPASAVGGAALIIWADLGARMVLAPLELPVGIVTALIGGPFFVFLLYRTRFVGGRNLWDPRQGNESPGSQAAHAGVHALTNRYRTLWKLQSILTHTHHNAMKQLMVGILQRGLPAFCSFSRRWQLFLLSTHECLQTPIKPRSENRWRQLRNTELSTGQVA